MKQPICYLCSKPIPKGAKLTPRRSKLIYKQPYAHFLCFKNESIKKMEESAKEVA